MPDFRITINTHMMTSSSDRILKTHHTFDITIWDELGNFAGFLPMLSHLGEVRAVYGGNVVRRLAGVTGQGGGIRNITVNPDPAGGPAPGYESWQHKFDQPASPLRGKLTLATDNPATRLRYKTPLPTGEYPFVGLTDLEPNLNDPNPDAARRWFILPDWNEGARTTIRAEDAPPATLQRHDGHDFFVWTHNKRGYDARPYDPLAPVDHATRSLASIRTDVNLVIPGAAKWQRLSAMTPYEQHPSWGSHVMRSPMGYGVIPGLNN